MNKRLKQTNKCYKCPNCKDKYLAWETKIVSEFSILKSISYLKCYKCFGEFEEYDI